MFDTLFSPIKIGSLEVKNRIIYPSLALLYSYDKTVNDRHVEFYRERAAGGAGIVTMGPVGFDKYGAGLIGPTIEPEESIESFKKVTDAIKEHGARAWVQLYHAGAYSKQFMIGNEQAIAPSAVPSNYTKETPREMTLDDIKEVQEAFVKGALNAIKAGFDGVEIIGSAGYLITQFLSPVTNKRTDEYGGSFENRTRFARELIEKMKEAMGDVPLSIRMAGNDFVPGGNTTSETPEFAKVYEKAGVDMINVTGGWHESKIPQLPMNLPRGAFAYLARKIKDAVSIPVVTSNRITEPYLAEQILDDGMADIVSLGRVLIADPYWPEKAQSGNEEYIRPCVACSQGCTDSVFAGKPVYCMANPRAGYEGERHITPAKNPKKVLVVGAGPGGLEAAVTAAEAGHNVTIYEKSDVIGGQIWLAGAPPYKQELWGLVDYYGNMLDKLDVELVMETEVTKEIIEKEKPDYVISAEGALQVKPGIPGLEGDHVLGAWDILEEDPPTGKNIAIIGGGAVGLETAHFLAVKGTITPETLHFLFSYNAEDPATLKELVTKGTKSITVFEMLPKAGNGVGKSTKWVLLGDLSEHGVSILTETTITSIEGKTISWKQGEKSSSEEFDTIVYATGSRPAREIADYLEKSTIPHAIIGDSNQPGKLEDAIHGGFLAALAIDSSSEEKGTK